MHSVFNTIHFIAKYHVGDDGHDLSISLPYLMGFVVVVVTLAVLMGLCMGVGTILQRVMPDAGVPKPILKPEAAPATTADEISPEILAVLTAAAIASEPTSEIATVIAAAAATMIDEPHRVISIKPQNSSWGQAGRQQIHSSHNIR